MSIPSPRPSVRPGTPLECLPSVSDSYRLVFLSSSSSTTTVTLRWSRQDGTDSIFYMGIKQIR